jgi:hypothetical protein
MTRLGSLVVLADHAAEYLPPPDWEVQRSGGLGFLVGRALLAGLVGPVPVVMAGVLAEDRSQVPFAVDEHPVGALGSCCAYPSLGVTVRPRRLRRGLYYFQALACEDLVEDGRELGVTVPDEEVEGTVPVSEIHDQVAGLLSGPGAIGMFGDAEDVDVPGGHFHDEQHVQAAQEDRLNVEEVAGQKPVRLSAEECPPGGVVPAGRWPACSAEDPPDGCRAEVVAEPGEFAVHAAVSPGGVLPGQPQYEVADFLAGLRSAGLTRVAPLVPDEAAVPGQQRSWRDQAVAAQPGWQQPGQRGQEGPVGPVRPGPGYLAAQAGHFVAEGQDLGVLSRLPAAQQVQPAKDPDDGEIQKSDRHTPRSCRIAVSAPNRRSRPLHGVLGRYRTSMFWQRTSVLAVVTAASFALMAGPAGASVGPPVYMLPVNQSGYQAQNSVGFQAYQATFIVPNAPADGQADLTGVSITDLTAGREAACGWLGIGPADGAIGCYDEADSSTGWVTLLASVSPGDLVTVTIRYAQTGRMTCKVTDLDTGATATEYFKGPTGEKWNEADIGAIPSMTSPGSPLTLSSFSNVRLTPVNGSSAVLVKGRWTVSKVIDTTDGTSAGQVVADPTAIKGDAFSVIQRP